MMTRLLRTVAIVCAAVSVVAAAGGRALAQDAAPALVDVVNDSSNPIPTTVTNNVPVTVTSGQVTTIPSADLNYVSFAGICGPSGGDAWVATLQGAVPLGLRLVIDSFSIEMSLPATTFAHVYIRPVQPGQAIDKYARQWVPVQSQGIGFAYGAQQRKILNANLPVHAIMDAGWNLDVVIQSSDILAASQSACFYAVLGHYVPYGLDIR